jgi:SAM-dependent methyltransferase
MLAVARALQVPPGAAAITWIEADAADMRLPAESFDAVVCQQGLQFFPDKPAALREMRRALVSGGRLAISVWRAMGVYNAAVGKALGQHVGVGVASRFCASRDVPAGDELVRLVSAARFQEVKLHVRRRIARLPSPEEFVLGHLAATPVAADVKAMSGPARAELKRSVVTQLSEYKEADGVAIPEEVNIVTACA